VEVIPGIFAFLVAAAGWFYLFYSRSASSLAAVEAIETNRLRVRLRRLGGACMLVLGTAFYVGYYGSDRNEPGPVFAFSWLIVFVMMMTILVLAIADLRLTRRLRRMRREALQRLSDLEKK
jgi:peptidoglycan/LPS O-acetylase OafA/YrhL